MAIRAICTADPYAWINDPHTEEYPERYEHGPRPGRKKLKVKKGQIIEFPSEELMPRNLVTQTDSKGNVVFGDDGNPKKKDVGISHFKILTGAPSVKQKKFESLTDKIDRLRKEIGMSPTEFEEYLSSRHIETESDVLKELEKTLSSMA